MIVVDTNVIAYWWLPGLVTTDRQILREFPGVARSLDRTVAAR